MTSKHVKGLYTLSFTNSTVNGLHIAKGSQLATEKNGKFYLTNFRKKFRKIRKLQSLNTPPQGTTSHGPE